MVRSPINAVATKRYVALDALRGLAALIVVFHHSLLILPGYTDAMESNWLLRPFIAGPSAVYVFFVLSGFVLFLLFYGKDGHHLTAFAARRLLRLYPPVFAAVLVALLIVRAIDPQPIPMLTAWFNDAWQHPLTVGYVLKHLTLWDHVLPMNTPLWSIVVELRLSLIFPLIALAIVKRPNLTVAFCLVISILCRLYARKLAPASSGSLVVDGQYLVLFAAGAWLAFNQHRVAPLVACRANVSLTIAALVVGVGITSCSPFAFGGIATMGGAILLVALFAFNPAVERWVDRPLFHALGRISYSLYLIHVVVIMASVHLLTGRMPPIMAISFGLIACIPVAAAMVHFVERPSIRLSREVGARLSASVKTRVTAI
ncbi:acyltransferase family protein [Sphingomonas sp. Leaf339]|uniref:acyltransferase family protein n=1 Tax=Sphingomonas sp. Leaf339 TaxID=1736343 RepID=UPI0006FAF7D8|nr:acyltransferase [Sphingomonas sp. Leaf339]